MALPIEKLTCLPEPLIPANGFSWNRHSMPCFWATRLRITISSCWWSAATLERSNMGASSNWPGATSLWRVLAGMPELEQLPLGVEHERQDPLGDGPEVVVVELLALGWLGPEQGPARVEQVGALQEEAAIDQEVLLLGAGKRHHRVRLVVPEQLEDPRRLLGHGLLRAQQGRLVVEGLARHRHEHRRDAQRVAVGVLQDVRGAGDVPAGVAAGLEGGPQATAREARCVGLALGQRLARELGDRRSVAARLQEAVVLLRGEMGQGVEDVGVVGRPLLHRPVLHGRRHHVGHRRIERLGVLDGGHQGLEHRLGEPGLHDRLGEHVLTEDLSRLLCDREEGGGQFVVLDRFDRLQAGLASTH